MSLHAWKRGWGFDGHSLVYGFCISGAGENAKRCVRRSLQMMYSTASRPLLGDDVILKLTIPSALAQDMKLYCSQQSLHATLNICHEVDHKGLEGVIKPRNYL